MRWLSVILVAASGCASVETGPQPRRLAPTDVRARMMKGDPLLLVCAYEAADCRGSHLAGSITLENLEARRDSLSLDREIVFFCG